MSEVSFVENIEGGELVAGSGHKIPETFELVAVLHFSEIDEIGVVYGSCCDGDFDVDDIAAVDELQDEGAVGERICVEAGIDHGVQGVG